MDKNSDKEKKRPVPPYLPYETLKNFIQRMHDTVVPSVADSTLFKTYSGSAKSQLRGALKFMGLVDESDRTMPNLKRLADAIGTPAWSEVLSPLFREAYAELIEDIDLTSGTRGQLEERFKNTGMDGDVLRKAIAFFITIAKDAGMSLSPHIVADRRGRPAQSTRNTKRPKVKRQRQDEDLDDGTPAPEGTARFNIPIPGKTPAARIILPEDVTMADWEMLEVMMRAYMQRREKPE